MHLERIGKRSFAFGLTWILSSEDASDAVAHAINDDELLSSKYVYYLRPEDAKKPKKARRKEEGERPKAKVSRSVGYCVSDERIAAMYSAAGVLARLGRDGLYVLQLTDGRLWYCAVRNGSVVPESDAVGSKDAILSRVIKSHRALNMPVFAAGELGIEEAHSFEVDRALGSANVAPMVRRQHGTPPAKLALLALILIAGGIFAKVAFFPSVKKLTPEEIQAAARAQYISGVQQELAQYPYPATPTWPVEALSRQREMAAPFVGGWRLSDVSCRPTACVINYEADKEHGFAFSALQQSFGPAVSVGDTPYAAVVTVPISALPASIDESWLQSLKPASSPFGDFVGRLPFAMSGAKVDGQPLSVDLQAKFGGAAAMMPAAVMEQIAVKQDGAIDPQTLVSLIHEARRSGFVPLQFNFSYGYGSKPASWRIAWGRIHG